MKKRLQRGEGVSPRPIFLPGEWEDPQGPRLPWPGPGRDGRGGQRRRGEDRGGEERAGEARALPDHPPPEDQLPVPPLQGCLQPHILHFQPLQQLQHKTHRSEPSTGPRHHAHRTPTSKPSTAGRRAGRGSLTPSTPRPSSPGPRPHWEPPSPPQPRVLQVRAECRCPLLGTPHHIPAD